MFQNALVYNAKGSDVYVMASTLKQYAQREIEPALQAEKDGDWNKELGRLKASTPASEPSLFLFFFLLFALH